MRYALGATRVTTEDDAFWIAPTAVRDRKRQARA